jgi:tetratricopeptide (TPR) repeat protein
LDHKFQDGIVVMLNQWDVLLIVAARRTAWGQTGMMRRSINLFCSATLLAIAFGTAISVHPAIALNGTDEEDCVYVEDAGTAIAACSRLLESANLIRQNRGIVYINRANAYHRKGDDDRALADIAKAISLFPKLAPIYKLRGDMFLGKGEYDRAIADYGEAIRLNPKYGASYSNRGVVYLSRGDPDRAIVDFNEAIRIDPKDTYSYVDRGNAYLKKGDYDRAIADYNEAIRINPKEASAHINRGDAYAAKGDYSRAIASYSEAIGIDPLDPGPLTGRGLAYEKMAEIAKARADFDAALAVPQKGANAKEAQDKARERLAALAGAPASAAPVTAAAAPVTSAVALSTAPVAVNDRRIALVIGNSAYENVPALPNPERDATFVAETLKRTGFESVTVQTNLRKEALIAALRDFAARAEKADWAVVYYAGHGMEVGGINYLVPVDARIAADRDIGFEAVPLEQVLNAAERAKKLRLVILDACRDNPFASQMKRTQTVASRSVTRGLAAVEPEAGTLVVYAAKDGETAIDGDGGNSPFAMAFVKNLQTPGLEVRRLFDTVRDDVMDATGRKQQPFSYGSISGRQDFYFVAGK